MRIYLNHKVPGYVPKKETEAEREGILRIKGDGRPMVECHDGVLRAPSNAANALFNRYKPGEARPTAAGNEHWGTEKESFATWMRRVQLEELEGRKSPTDRDWTDDELVMALHLYLNRPSGLKGASEKDIQRLGSVLWRTRGSVGQKVSNLIAAGTSGRHGRTHGNEQDRVVALAWWDRPDELAVRFEELLARWTETPWSEVEVHPLVRRGGPTQHDLAGWLDHERKRLERAMARSVKRGRQARKRMSVGRDSGDQRTFSDGVLACYQLAVGFAAMRCPGCRNDFRKANGKPLLEAHHLVSVADDANFDHRAGTPLCPTCHALAEVGSREVQYRLMASAFEAHPELAANLYALRDEGVLDEPTWEKLLESGCPLDPWSNLARPRP